MKACPVCCSLSLEDHQDLCRCRHCGHVFQRQPTISVRYDASYVVKHHLYPMVQSSYLRVGFVKAYCDRGRLLDVGHGIGDFVRAVRLAGLDAYGYDVHGVDVQIPTIERLDDGQRWDMVTFFDSLEHFADLEPVRELAARARQIIVACPLMPIDFPIRRDWKHYRPGEHLHYFTAGSLRALFAGHEQCHLSDVEDAVRGRTNGQPNILTCVFRQRQG